MRAYIITTGTLFGLLTLAHIWRGIVERTTLAEDPWFLLTTALAAAMCFRAVRLLRRSARQG